MAMVAMKAGMAGNGSSNVAAGFLLSLVECKLDTKPSTSQIHSTDVALEAAQPSTP